MSYQHKQSSLFTAPGKAAFIDMSDYPAAARRAWIATVVLGGMAFAWSLWDRLANGSASLESLLAWAALAALAGFFPVRIPGTRTSLSGGEIFNFLVLMLFGATAAVVVAAVEGFVAAVRGSKRWTSRIVTPCISSLAMLGLGSLIDVARQRFSAGTLSGPILLICLAAFGIAYFALQTFLVASILALKSGKRLTPVAWWASLRWVGLSFTANAIIAGLLFLSYESIGISVLLVALPVIAMFLTTLHSHVLRKEADQRADDLLKNVLPAGVADALKNGNAVPPRRYEEVTVLFADFSGFTAIASTIPARALVSELNDIFSRFDEIMAEHGVEKIKTIGDAYMAAAGVPLECPDHAVRCARAALEMLRWMEERNAGSSVKWPLRIGLHSGPVVAGLIGKAKYSFDLWGDTVNIASRLESTSEPGRANVSAYTFGLLREQFRFEYRGKLEAKGKGPMDMYFLGAALIR